MEPGETRHLSVWGGDPRVIVSAPHGRDFHTAAIAQEVCGILGCRGMAIPHVEDPETGLRVNINRPTEGAGLTADEETETELAHGIYRKYLGLVLRLGGGSGPELYVEIHGNETQDHVEIATVRIPDESRYAMKVALIGMPSSALIEGLDRIVLDADQSRQHGLLRFIPRAIHFELTEEARHPENHALTARHIAEAVIACVSAL